MSLSGLSKITVCNTGPLIALLTIHHENLLSELFTTVLIPEEVKDELFAGKHLFDKTRFKENFVIQPLKKPHNPLLISVLDIGEASVIQTALEQNINSVIIDEKKARKIAKNVYKLDVIGTIGLLVEAKQKGIIEDIKPLIEQLADNGYWIHHSIVSYALSLVGEN